MRTDVKVGLISLFVIVLAVVGYFAWQSQRGGAKSTEVQPTGETGLVNNDTPGLSGPIIAPPPARSSGADNLSGSAVVIMPPETGPAATTQSLTGAVSARDALPSIIPTPATAPGTTYPASFGTAGGSASSVSIEPAGGKRAIDFSPAPSSDLTSAASSSELHSSSTGYTVKKGDTFAKIARTLKTSVASLEAANPGISSNHLKIGQVLAIPSDAGATTSSGSSSSSTSATSSESRSVSRSTESSVRETQGASSARPSTYVVKKGDTLTKIARKYYGDEKAWQRIMRANRDILNRDGSNLKVGMELRLPE